MPPFLHAILLITLLATVVPGPALAQTSVAVYGNLDLGISKTSGSSPTMGRGYNNWIGLKGNEDLGGGSSVIFNLQARFLPDTGQQERPQTFWQGESTVGLKTASSGTLRLGRALSPLWQEVWAYEPWLNSGFNASLSAYQTGGYSSDGVNDAALGFANFSRVANGVFYTSPEFAGLTAHLVSEVERSAGAAARVLGASFNLAKDGVGAMLSVERNAEKDRIAFAGASYRIGPATIMGSFARNVFAAGRREHVFVLAGTCEFGPGTVRAGYGRNREADADKLGIGYVHALSKRTKLYADLFRERASVDTNGIAAGMSHAF